MGINARRQVSAGIARRLLDRSSVAERHRARAHYPVGGDVRSGPNQSPHG